MGRRGGGGGGCGVVVVGDGGRWWVPRRGWRRRRRRGGRFLPVAAATGWLLRLVDCRVGAGGLARSFSSFSFLCFSFVFSFLQFRR